MPYEIVREERKTLLEEAYLVDLMSELYEAKAEDEEVIFTLTSEAFRKMCAFPSVKDIHYFLPREEQQCICIEWTSAPQRWMSLMTSDRCKTYFVLEIRSTQETEYECPMKEGKVVQYIID